ncbi:tyrosine-type recombinase/integrase [Cyclobacterium roseum]|uniref:tyrosine-type recombinase/integrase n=1 Tax=Cyclobacterium roseum TaxID=2666137 RepID=UPI001390CD8B|nr:site-specific integrase [Cyclobacterium roseum]
MRKKTDKAKDPVAVNFYHDTRRKKDNGLFPVRIRVYDSTTKRARLYTTDFDLSIKNFDKILFPERGQRLRPEEREFKNSLEGILSFYQDKVHNINAFTFEALENSLSIKSGEYTNVFFHYENYIQELKRYNKFSTASNYELSMRSLKSYLGEKKGRQPTRLIFQDVTVKFLNDFEYWMTAIKKRSTTTVSMYLRALKTIFNRAIDAEAIDKEFYPFGVKKYEIPASTNVKKSFDSDQLSILFKAKPKTSEQEKARDFWFFSFVCNGMNMKDIIHLKWKDIQDGQIVFIREKTKVTKKANIKPIQVPLSDFAEGFIKKYRNEDQRNGSFVFPILDESMTEEEMHKRKQNFIRYINQHLKKLAEANGLTGDISTYWARHSFATTAVRKKASMEYVSEALGHSDLKTTKNYFAGFEDKTKKEILEDITDFMR